MSPVTISHDVLEQAGVFFEARGSRGCEGTAMIASSITTAQTRLVIPNQQAGIAPRSWVEVTDTGKLELAAALGPDDRYVARIHSHPMDAFHSPTDDVNPAITFEGALSIVVPFFGLGLRRGLDACAVLQYRDGNWIDLPPGAARDSEVIT